MPSCFRSASAADALLDRDIRIDRVELRQCDDIHVQAAKAALAVLADLLRSTPVDEPAGRADDPDFGHNMHAVGVHRERLADKVLAHPV